MAKTSVPKRTTIEIKNIPGYRERRVTYYWKSGWFLSFDSWNFKRGGQYWSLLTPYKKLKNIGIWTSTTSVADLFKQIGRPDSVTVYSDSSEKMLAS